MPKADHGPLFKLACAAALAASALATAPRAQGNAGATLTLEQAMREAMGKSEEALMLKEKQVKFEALKRQAWSSGMPQVVVEASAGRGSSPTDPSIFPIGKSSGSSSGGSSGGGGFPTSVFDVTLNRFAYDVSAQQSIFSFGRLTQAIHVAGVQQSADDAARSRSIQQLQLMVLDAFYGVINSRARLAALEASVKRYEQTVGFLESNWKMGSGVKANVLRAVTALKSLEPQRINAQRDAEAARMRLNGLLGRDLDAPMDLDSTKVPEMAVPAVLPDSQAVQSVLEDRPDLKSLELNRQSLEGQAKYLKMQYLPSLGAQGKWGITAYKLNQLGDFDKNQDWTVGLGLQWHLFDGFGLLSQAQQLQSDARSLGLTAREARKMTQVEIRSAFRDYQAADTALAAAEQAVQAAQEAQAMLSEDFRAGKGQLTDLLEAENALRDTQLGVLNARYMRVRSQAALRIAMGKALINEEVP